MRKVTLALTFALCLVFTSTLLVLPGSVHAQSRIPQVIGTTRLDWNDGTNYGARVVFGVSNPPIQGGSGQYWHRRLLLTDASSGEGDVGQMEMGIEKVGAGDTDPYCGNYYANATLVYYDYVVTPAGHTDVNCHDVPSKDINTDTRFTLSAPFGTSGGYAEFYNNHNGTTLITDNFDFTGIDLGLDPDYSDEYYSETFSGTLSGHTIWGVRFTQNMWMDGNHVLHNHTTPSGNHTSGCSGAGCPSPADGTPRWYWEDGHYPADSGSNSGTRDACTYASYPGYPYCTIGG